MGKYREERRTSAHKGIGDICVAATTVVVLLLGFAPSIYAQSLCTNGHPARLISIASYSSLQPRQGGHIIPLCLGGPDILNNLQHQSLDKARIKDEWQVCEEFCRGGITLEGAKARFR